MAATRTTIIAGLLALTSCASEPAPGEFGNFRYLGNVRGATPLPMLPPVSDRDGNVYVMYGATETVEFGYGGFVGHQGGGWTGGCSVTSGITATDNFGVHGWVGRAQNRAWFWVNTALAEMSGAGNCSRVLETDPTSGSQLRFRALLPMVRETPSRTTVVAYVQTLSDPRPYVGVIDLNARRYTELDDFDPNGATNVEILGVGAHPREHEGVVVVRYQVGESVYVEARFYDHQANELEKVRLAGLDDVPQYGILGYVQPNDNGLWAALTGDGRIALFDRTGGEVTDASDMDPVGIHRWEGSLYLVGESGGRPRLAAISDDGDVGSAATWEASLDAADNLGSIEVIDDRSLPSRRVDWNNARTAMGSFPFLHPHSLDYYADGTTTWLVAGPSFAVSGEDRTAVAFAPVGIRYE